MTTDSLPAAKHAVPTGSQTPIRTPRSFSRRLRNYILELLLGAFLANLIFYILSVSFVQLKFVYAGF